MNMRKQLLDLIIPWIAAGAVAMMIASCGVSPVRGTWDWVIVVGSGAVVMALTWWGYRALMASAGRSGAETAEELRVIDRFVHGLRVEEAEVVCRTLIAQGEIFVTTVDEVEPSDLAPLAMRLAGPARSLFEEFASLEASGMHISRDQIEEWDDPPGSIKLGSSDDLHGVVLIDPASGEAWTVYEGEPGERRASIWHVVLIESMAIDGLRAMARE